MWWLIGIGAFLGLVVVWDLVQHKHAILRNFPILGHLRYLVELVGPELRQYIVARNDEERPFDRDQRRWVYASSKKQNNYFGFGTDDDLELGTNHVIVKHSAFPINAHDHHHPGYAIPGAKVMGGSRGRKLAFRPPSILTVSAMSFGSLSANAVQAINRGCAMSDCLHNTGEGGIAHHHRHGGGLIYQLGTGYYGARAKDGTFSMELFLNTVASADVKAIEIKLSQGAKPGKGGVLPGAKVTKEIASVRGIPIGQDCLSPSSHSAFDSPEGMIDFIETLADETGLPVGIKSAVGDERFWHELAGLMKETGRGPDYIQVDGGEGGTGAAPLAFSDHVALPFKIGFTRVWRIFKSAGIEDRVVWVGSGRLGFPVESLLAFGLGCDMIALAREPMMAIGCIQAQRCHSGHCPTGVATQSKWLMRGLDPTHKASRLANYLTTLRKEILELCHACRVEHPALITPDHFEIMDGHFGGRSPRDVFGYESGWGACSDDERRQLLSALAEEPAA
ncbi:MAG: FMN-binding glutamate synthase family protein [Planctomycetes bacterium]|nr:FMN-binding glutamate synthase family protein [Planctomycetota bacterium]